MAFEIVLARNQPFTADIPIIGGNPADVHFFRRPVRAKHQLLFLLLRPAGDMLGRRAGDGVTGGIVPADDGSCVGNSAGRGFAHDITVDSPARSIGDKHIRLVTIKQVAIQARGVPFLNLHQRLAGSGGPSQHFHQPAHGNIHRPSSRRTLFNFNLANVSIHGLGVDAARTARPAQEIQPPLRVVMFMPVIIFGLLDVQPFNDQTRPRKAGGNTFDQVVVRQQDDFHAGIQQGRNDIALQKIHHREAVVGCYEDASGSHIILYPGQSTSGKFARRVSIKLILPAGGQVSTSYDLHLPVWSPAR